MTLARIRGTVVATHRSDGLASPCYLLVEACTASGEGRGEFLVALDMIGAERGQLVLVAQGSSCRWTSLTVDRPMDALVIGIADLIDIGGRTVWDEARRDR